MIIKMITNDARVVSITKKEYGYAAYFYKSL